METNVYIDGFNLYYRALRGTPLKWLDVRKLSESLFPNDRINRVCFFTARVVPRKADPYQGHMQLIYLRALATLPGVEIHYGSFRPRRKRRPLVNPAAGQSRFVEVLDTEEKGTEVNLATELLVDSFKSNYEQAVIVSSDADFATAMRYVKNDLGLRMTFVNPDRTSSPPRDLSAAATYVKNLRSSHLRASQLPLALFDAKGSITKPDAW